MSKKKKTYNPPPKPHTISQQIPSKYSSYLLLNPAFPIETVYQLLSASGKSSPMMIIRGTPEDFADEPNVMFRKVNQEVNLQQNDSENTIDPQ